MLLPDFVSLSTRVIIYGTTVSLETYLVKMDFPCLFTFSLLIEGSVYPFYIHYGMDFW